MALAPEDLKLQGVYRVYIRVYGGYIIGFMQGLCRGYVGVVFGLYWENGKENGKYHLGFRV